MMAVKLKETVGADLLLQRTPRVYTVRGPLDKYTTNWTQDLFPEPVNLDTLLDSKHSQQKDDEDDMDFFHRFMKEEIGEEEYNKTMEGRDAPEDQVPQELFNLLGNNANNDVMTKQIQELMELALTSEDEKELEAQIGKMISGEIHGDNDKRTGSSAPASSSQSTYALEEVALKLVSAVLPLTKKQGGGKRFYSLVQLL